jgi:phage terminase small subunit
MKPTIENILEDITDEQVARARPKAAKGRPKSAKRVAKERTAAEEAFVANYEPKVNYRPEPKRLILALARPPEEQQKALEDALLPRQLAFCKEYVLDFKQREAAVRAGYSPKTAEGISHNLMAYRGITRLIELYTQSNAQRITTVDADWVIQKVTEIVTGTSKDSDKLTGLNLLAKHLGMFIERTEISGRDGEAIKIQETKNNADEVARRLREMGKKAALSVVSK